MNLNFRHSTALKPAISLKDFYISSFLFAAGAVLVIFPSADSVISELGKLGLFVSGNMICICSVICLLIIFCGISAVGNVSVFIADCVCGAFISAGVRENGISADALSVHWFIDFAEVFLIFFCGLIVSNRACVFSREIYSILSGDKAFSTRLIKYSAFSVSFILVVTSLFYAIFKLKQGL